MGIMQRAVSCHVLTGTNATDGAQIVWPYAESGVLESIYIENEVAVTADNTDNITISATMNATTAFSRQTNVAGGALGQGVHLQTLGTNMVGEKKEVNTGEAISVAVAKAGTGPTFKLRVTLVFNLIN